MSNKTTYSKDYQEIIQRLKLARLQVGLTQSQVAEKLGKPQSYISKIESRERRLDVLEIKKLAQVYDKNISFFLH